MTESPTSATVTDLTEYVDAAARAMYAHQWTNGPDFDDGLTPLQQCNYREAVTPIVAAAAPLIERDARAAALEEAAEQCEADASDWYGTDIYVSAHMFRRALEARARILRDSAQAIREGT